MYYGMLHYDLLKDSTGINNGVWMLRNSPWSHDFLERPYDIYYDIYMYIYIYICIS